MDNHTFNLVLKSINSDVQDRLKELKNKINFIAKLDKAEPARELLEYLNVVIDSNSEYLSNIIEHYRDMLEASDIPKESIGYHYLLVTVGNNDFFRTLDCLGETLVKIFGDELCDHKFDFERLVKVIPSLFSSFSQIQQCSGIDLNYVKKYIKIFYTDESIIDFINKYGMDFSDEKYGCFENEILKDNSNFKGIIHLSCNAEVLIVKFAYNKTNNSYIESMSDWSIF